MKKYAFIVSVLFVIVALTTAAQGQFVFSVRPEMLGINGAAFGYRFPAGTVAIYGGMDYIHASATVSSSGSSVYTQGGSPPQISNSSGETETSLSLYNVFAGAKFFVLQSGSAKGYLTGEVSKPFVSIGSQTNGQDNPAIKQISDNLSIWGVKAGVGGEYFFSDEFSLGGEFGLRMFFASTKEGDTSSFSGGVPPNNYSYSYTWSTDVKVNLGLTYTTLTLNYYFH